LSTGFSKLLICGGLVIDTCEIIDLNSPTTTCKNPPSFPKEVYAAIGGLGFLRNPIICGGFQNTGLSNSCYTLENNEWVPFASMNSVRIFAAAAQLKDGKLLVTGGGNGFEHVNNVEILTEDSWESNLPNPPVAFVFHCMVTLNSTTVIVIGGIGNGLEFSGKTFYFTVGEESWSEGPALKYERGYFSCGKIRRGKESQEMSVIVAGGSDGLSYMSSVEILDEGSHEWQTGPELPFGIWNHQMVENQNGGVVLIGGRSSSTLDTLYQLSYGGQDAVWTKMEQKMKTPRSSHTAFLIPDNIVDCSLISKQK
jgi:hypothetical protein